MNDMIFLIVFGVLLLLLLLLPASKIGTKRSRGVDKRFVQQQWQKTVDISRNKDQSARFAVIEADKLLDYVLKSRGYGGETMADRLRSANKDFSYKDDVWSAHKLRNKLVHEAQYEVDKRLIDKSLNQFRQALKDLGAL